MTSYAAINNLQTTREQTDLDRAFSIILGELDRTSARRTSSRFTT